MEGKFTVYFADPFWVGVYERQCEDGYSVARVVFGSEPTDAELYQFIQEHYDEFRFGPALAGGSITEDRRNYKRAQREARRTMQEHGIGTKAQQAMKLSLEQAGAERQQLSRLERERDAQERFSEHQQKKKEKHRGH